VVKEANKTHYVWINSSLRYQGKPFPSAEALEEALEKIRQNIAAKKNE
jgi:hypothetical protein